MKMNTNILCLYVCIYTYCSTHTQVPNDTAYTRWSCDSGLANCVYPSRLQKWGPITVFWASQPCRPAGWLAMLLIKAGDVETNPGLTTTPLLDAISATYKYKLGSRYR